MSLHRLPHKIALLPPRLALLEWELCVKAAAKGDRAILAQLSAQGQSALHLVGGLYKLGMSSEEQLTWMKKEFVSVWKSTPANVKTLPQPRTLDFEQIDAVRSLSQKMSLSLETRHNTVRDHKRQTSWPTTTF